MQNGRITELADRITYLESQRAPPLKRRSQPETKYAQEHDRAEFLIRLASWYGGITIIIIIIIFVVYVWRA